MIRILLRGVDPLNFKRFRNLGLFWLYGCLEKEAFVGGAR